MHSFQVHVVCSLGLISDQATKQILANIRGQKLYSAFFFLTTTI